MLAPLMADWRRAQARARGSIRSGSRCSWKLVWPEFYACSNPVNKSDFRGMAVTSCAQAPPPPASPSASRW